MTRFRRGRMPVALAAALLGAIAPPTAAAAQSDPPALTARSAIVIEASTGDVAYARRADERRQIASTTKMMTALVSRSDLSLGQTLRAAPYAALPVESKIDLRTGEPMRVADLLRALMLASANDAAVTLAVGSAGSLNWNDIPANGEYVLTGSGTVWTWTNVTSYGVGTPIPTTRDGLTRTVTVADALRTVGGALTDVVSGSVVDAATKKITINTTWSGAAAP
ncbi:MAG: D-alanyl-D-alanine carboxypeptidase family protein, partial [Baekduiaceae bacterium]